MLHACSGTILCSGVGKSGFIAQKICQTLVSTGTRSVFLSPTDALHGDIGILGRDDVLVLFSKSGGTEELLRLIPYARAKGAKLVAVVNVPGSKLEAQCDDAVLLPLSRELCPFDLAPVSSTALQMLFGDTVAIALMQARHLSREEYAMNHPAGRIGRRLILRVVDVMRRGDEVPVVAPDTKVADALSELSAKGCGAVLVAEPRSRSPQGRPSHGPATRGSLTDSGEEDDHEAAVARSALSTTSSIASLCDAAEHVLVGVFTDGDLRRALQSAGDGVAKLLDAPIATIMTKKPRYTQPELKAVDAMNAMEASPKVSVLPVVHDGKLVGIVTLHGLISAGI